MKTGIEDKRAELDAAGQGHVLAYWDELDAAGQARLAEDLREIEVAEVERLVETLVKGEGEAPFDPTGLAPAPYIGHPERGGDAALWAKAREAGEAALRAGKVAAFTVAGGQGTRLGYDGPKGTFPVTPVRGRPLFAVFAGKLRAASKRYGVDLPWFIMTSEQNHEATVAAFEADGYYGLKAEQVHFFRQGRMPAVDFAGRILLAEKDAVAMSPDGHGGALRALVRSGAVAKMKEAGVEMISYFQVDNPLVRVIDPAFVGFHQLHGSEMSSKMVPKAHAGEKVGHFCERDGKTMVVEYSDMPELMQEAKTEKGELVYRAGSIAIHILDVDFVQRVGGEGEAVRLPFHRADKKIKCLDETGHPVKPEKPNGVKFEMFVFDALPFAANPVIVETLREEDFSPVKNAEGADSPASCRRDQLRQWARWLEAAGVSLPLDEEGVPTVCFEVDPLFADSAEALVERWRSLAEKPEILEGTILQ